MTQKTNRPEEHAVRGENHEVVFGQFAARFSPVADASGRLYFATAGVSYVVQAGEEFKVLAVNDLGDPNHASPAVAGGRQFLVGHAMRIA
jgi:hypothetical protein